MTWRSLFCLAGFAAAVMGPCRADADIVEHVTELQVRLMDGAADARRHTIKVHVFRDDTRPSSPYLILNHGRAPEREKRQALTAAPYRANARYFASKGFAVLLPIRVGYGTSAGPDVENSGGCAAKQFAPAYEAAANQTIAVIQYATSLPYIDKDNGLVVGQSFGGTTAIAIAARTPAGVKGAVNFAGGGGGRPGTHPGQPCSPQRMTALYASYGATARIPTLWMYSENDQYWGPAIPRDWLRAFTNAGGLASFVQLPPYKSDGHSSFTGNPSAWRPAFEEFLRACCPSFNLVRAPAAAAESVEVYSRILATWAAKHKVERASIVVRRNGRVIHQAGIGGEDPAAAVHLASLSKAITGGCIATLVRDGRLDFDSPLSTVLARFFAAHGRPADRRIEHITIAQLLTHRAGFAGSSDGEDPATRAVLDAYLRQHSTRDAPRPQYLAAVLATGLRRDPGTEFAYSNAGYLALGAVIEEVTGQDYESYCRDAVLTASGAAGRLDPAWRVMGAYGGWQMSGADYLSFLEQLDLAAARFGPRVADWVVDTAGKTYGEPDGSTWYGLGLRLRRSRRGIEMWHTGSWRRRFSPDAQGPRTADTSTFAMRLPDRTAWFVHSSPLVLGNARAELGRALLAAYDLVQERH
jgi:CubicO group peptidase (beta-lactamase class C family)